MLFWSDSRCCWFKWICYHQFCRMEQTFMTSTSKTRCNEYINEISCTKSVLLPGGQTMMDWRSNREITSSFPIDRLFNVDCLPRNEFRNENNEVKIDFCALFLVSIHLNLMMQCTHSKGEKAIIINKYETRHIYWLYLTGSQSSDYDSVWKTILGRAAHLSMWSVLRIFIINAFYWRNLRGSAPWKPWKIIDFHHRPRYHTWHIRIWIVGVWCSTFPITCPGHTVYRVLGAIKLDRCRTVDQCPEKIKTNIPQSTWHSFTQYSRARFRNPGWIPDYRSSIQCPQSEHVRKLDSSNRSYTSLKSECIEYCFTSHGIDFRLQKITTNLALHQPLIRRLCGDFRNIST